MKIKDLHPHAAVTAAPSETLRSAAKRLTEEEVGALVIYDTIGPSGVFSERDLARAVADDVDIDETQIKEYMTDAPISVGEGASVREGIDKMNEYGVRHLLVTEDDDGVVGVLSMRDVVHLFEGASPRL